jgi:hypothetical protein
LMLPCMSGIIQLASRFLSCCEIYEFQQNFNWL